MGCIWIVVDLSIIRNCASLPDKEKQGMMMKHGYPLASRIECILLVYPKYRLAIITLWYAPDISRRARHADAPERWGLH